MTGRVEGKVAFVSGAVRGQGRGHATAFRFHSNAGSMLK